MKLNFLIEFPISVVAFSVIFFNRTKFKFITKNKLLLYILVLVFIFIHGTIKSVLGYEDIIASIVSGIIYPIYVCIISYLILNKKRKVYR